MKIKVQCTVIVEVDVPDECEDPYFVIEENGCPGTGVVGAAIDEAYARGESNSTCWACALQGENKILEINGSVRE